MKTIVIYLMCMILSGIAFGQVDEEIAMRDTSDDVSKVPPKFIGVTNAISVIKDGKAESINDYLARNIEYPEKDRKSFNQGTEVVQFMIAPNGELTDFTIINSVSPEIDEEVIRVLETTNGMWIPGYNNNEPFAMEKELSVAFKINGVPHPLDFEAQGIKYFAKGGDLLLTQNNPKKALKFYDKAIQLLPNDESILLMRGFAKYGVGNLDGAMHDWERIKYLGGAFDDGYLTNLTGLDGYAEFIDLLREKPEPNNLLISKH